MSRSKALVLSHTSELVGGAERSIVEVLDILSDTQGLEPEFILREPVGTLGPEISKRGWKYHSIPYTYWSESSPLDDHERLHKRALQNSQAVLRIEEIIDQVKPDIVLTNSIVCPWAAIAAYYRRVPHIWFVREYGDLDHGRVFDIGQSKTLKDVDLLSQLVITNSKALATHLSQYIPRKKIVTLYHPFDIQEMISSSEETVKDPFTSKGSLKLVLPAGVVTASKGFQEAVTAVGELNQDGHDVELCVIGRLYEKEFISKLKEITKHYNISNKVHFIGFQKNPLPFVRLADVGIMASRMEAFGRVTFEYLALGKPVVGVGAGGTPEMVEDGYNGYLFKYADYKSLVKALINYIDSPELKIVHGQNSRRKAEDMMRGNHNIDNLYKRIEQVLGMKESQLPTIFNFTHEWLVYPSISNSYFKGRGVNSIRRLIKRNIKARLTHYLNKAKAFYRRKFR